MGNKNGSSEIYVVGKNDCHEFGTDLTSLRKLKKIYRCSKSKNPIQNICSGNGYTIYSNENNENIWISGPYSMHRKHLVIHSNDAIILHPAYSFTFNNIKVKKIHANISGEKMFWVSKSVVYGNDRNELYKVGIGDGYLRYLPQIIQNFNKMRDIQTVVDIQSAKYYCIVLYTKNKCSFDTLVAVINRWSKTHDLPCNIVNLIVIYYQKVNEIYSAGYSSQLGINCYGKQLNMKWKKISIFTNKNIIQIASGGWHSLFLESTGVLWSCGDNEFGQIGMKNGCTTVPNPVVYFGLNRIKIKMIKCGVYHNLVIDYDGKLYSWGRNTYGQCGNGTLYHICTPCLVDTVARWVVNKIECGASHSYCCTVNQRHFLFGSNADNECLKTGCWTVTEPYFINDMVKNAVNKGNNTIIEMVSLGNRNTKILVSTK